MHSCHPWAEQFPLVRYIPAPPTSVRESRAFDQAKWEAQWEASELRTAILETNRAGCHICTEDFKEPKKHPHLSLLDSLANRFKMDPSKDTAKTSQQGDEGGEQALVLLDCTHVLHQACIGRWLYIQPSCPVCLRRIWPDANWTSLYLERQRNATERHFYRMREESRRAEEQQERERAMRLQRTLEKRERRAEEGFRMLWEMVEGLALDDFNGAEVDPAVALVNSE